jgi:hypothetical protein
MIWLPVSCPAHPGGQTLNGHILGQHEFPGALSSLPFGSPELGQRQGGELRGQDQEKQDRGEKEAMTRQEPLTADPHGQAASCEDTDADGGTGPGQQQTHGRPQESHEAQLETPRVAGRVKEISPQEVVDHSGMHLDAGKGRVQRCSPQLLEAGCRGPDQDDLSRTISDGTPCGDVGRAWGKVRLGP